MAAWLTLQDLLPEFSTQDGAAVLAFEGAKTTYTTFAELRDGAMRIARDLAARGLTPGVTIGVMGANSAAWIESFLGVIAAGCTAMPIDIQVEDNELRRMLEISECRLVLAGKEQAVRLGRCGVECVPLGLCDTEPAQGAEGVIVALTARPEDAAVLVFTSGTTGTPKPVVLSHANLISNVKALRMEQIVGPGDHVLLPLPLHHVYPLTVGLLTVLASGATIVLPAGISGPQLVEAIRIGEVTVLLGVPRLYGALLAGLRTSVAHRKGPEARLFPMLLALADFTQRRVGLRLGHFLFRQVRAEIGPKLRLMVSGGAALPLRDEWTLKALGWQVLTGYGLSETSPILTFNRPARPRVGTAGQVLPGVRVRIASPDASGIGEIQATGCSVFSGYRKDEIATHAAFTSDGWLRTGDFGYLDADSYLHVTGRVTEAIILPNGKKIDPEMLEAMYAVDPAIQEIAVLSSASGLTALIVPDERILRESGALRLRDRIADAILVRSRTLAPYLRLSGFAVTRTVLPRTPLGKLRRHMLPQLYARAARQEQPEPAYPAVADTPFDDPRVAAVWQWLCARFPAQKMSLATSPQLDLGLDSLGWIDLTLALQQDLGIDLTEEQIARVITVGDLLREAAAAQAHALAAGNGAATWHAPQGPGLQITRAAGEISLRLFMRLFFRLKADGLRHLPAPPFVICPNHVSYLDAFALAAALPHHQLRNSFFAGWARLLFTTPMKRLFSRVAQIVPVDPDRAVAASIANAATILREGKILIWFPEGRISENGDLQPFQPGIGAVLLQQPVPIVPAWIEGTAAALPAGGWFPHPHPVTVRFGPAIDFSEISPNISGRARQQYIASTIREAVAALAPSGAPGNGVINHGARSGTRG